MKLKKYRNIIKSSLVTNVIKRESHKHYENKCSKIQFHTDSSLVNMGTAKKATLSFLPFNIRCATQNFQVRLRKIYIMQFRSISLSAVVQDCIKTIINIVSQEKME